MRGSEKEKRREEIYYMDEESEDTVIEIEDKENVGKYINING